MRLELAGDHGPSVAAVCHRAADLLGEDPLCARSGKSRLLGVTVWPYVLTRAYPTIIADPLCLLLRESDGPSICTSVVGA